MLTWSVSLTILLTWLSARALPGPLKNNLQSPRYFLICSLHSVLPSLPYTSLNILKEYDCDLVMDMYELIRSVSRTSSLLAPALSALFICSLMQCSPPKAAAAESAKRYLVLESKDESFSIICVAACTTGMNLSGLSERTSVTSGTDPYLLFMAFSILPVSSRFFGSHSMH